MKVFNNYPFSLEIHCVKPDLNFTSRWRNFIVVRMGTTGSMKRLRTAALCTLVGIHSWSMAQPEIGVIQGHNIRDGAKYRCSLGLMLCLNSLQVYGLRHKTGGPQPESTDPQGAIQPGRLCVSGLPMPLGLVVPSQTLS